MRWLSRLLAAHFARRVSALIFVSAIVWCFMDTAEAALPCGSQADKCTKPQAYASAMNGTGFCAGTSERVFLRWDQPLIEINPDTPAAYFRSYPRCGTATNSYGYTTQFYYTTGCSPGQEFNLLRGICQESCSSRPQKIVDYKQMIPSGSYACIDGCEARIAPSADGGYFQTFVGGTTSHCGVLPSDCSKFGAGYGMNFGTSMCQPPFDECASNQVKDPVSGICTDGCEPGKIMDASGVCKPPVDECPPGNIKSPSGGCLPGDGQCAAGEARGKDGTCKRDADGDGKPDAGEDEGNTDETFSGGDSCNAPPACSGSPIMCGQARIQWRIDCNTRKNRNVSGGACSAVPLCTGEKCDAMEYSSLLMQWRTACAMEKLAGKGDGGGDDGQPAWTRVDGMNQNPGAGEGAGDTPTVGEKQFSTDDLDQSGFGGGMCMGFAGGGGSGAVGQAYALEFGAPNAEWCLFISRLRASLIVIAAAAACFIIARGV